MLSPVRNVAPCVALAENADNFNAKHVPRMHSPASSRACWHNSQRRRRQQAPGPEVNNRRACINADRPVSRTQPRPAALSNVGLGCRYQVAAHGHAAVSVHAAGAAWQPLVEHVLMSLVASAFACRACRTCRSCVAPPHIFPLLGKHPCALPDHKQVSDSMTRAAAPLNLTCS